MADSGTYASALSNLRDSVKWLVASAAAAGAVIFSGLAITNISELAQLGHWVRPTAYAAAPLAAAIAVVIASLRVINVKPPATSTLFPKYWHELTGEGRAGQAPTLATELPAAISIYQTVDRFDEKLAESQKDIKEKRNALDTAQAADKNDRSKELGEAYAEFEGLLPILQDTLACAMFVEARNKFKTATVVLLFAVVVATAGVIASGVDSGDRMREQQAAAQSAVLPLAFRVPTDVNVYFRSRPPAEAGGRLDCPVWSGIPAVAEGGTFERPLLLFPGYTVREARRNGMTQVSPQCDQPWWWAPDYGQVLLVPRS